MSTLQESKHKYLKAPTWNVPDKILQYYGAHNYIENKWIYVLV